MEQSLAPAVFAHLLEKRLGAIPAASTIIRAETEGPFPTGRFSLAIPVKDEDLTPQAKGKITPEGRFWIEGTPDEIIRSIEEGIVKKRTASLGA